MPYVDGFLTPVPAENREAYIKLAEKSAAIFKRNGALSAVECWGDDVPEGEVTSFPMAVKLQPGETVVFSWIIWPSRAARDEGMGRSMQDFEKEFADETMPFDGKRMMFGGFETIVDE